VVFDPSQSPSYDGEPIDDEPGAGDELRNVLVLLRRHWVLILAVVLASTAVAAVRTYRLQPVYAASARLQLAKEAPDPTYAKYMTYWEGIQQEYLNTQIAIMQSHPLALHAIEAHPQLARELELDLTERAGPGAGAVTADDLAWSLLGGISARPVKDTYLVDVSYESTDPTRCARYANAVAEAYISQLDELRGQKTRLAEEKIAEQAELLYGKLERSERELREFLEKSSPLFDRHEELLASRIGANDQSLAHVENRRNRLEAELETISRIQELGKPIDIAPSIVQNPIVKSLREELTQVEIEIAGSAQRYGDDWPAVKLARTRRDQLKLLMREEIDRIREGLEVERDQLVAEERGLRQRSRQLDEESRELARQSHVYQNLNSEVEANRRFYDEFATRLKELSHYSQVSINNVRMIDRAAGAVRVRPDHRRNIALGALFGLAVAVGLVLLIERLADRIRTPNEAMRALQLPVLSVVPALEDATGVDADLYALTRPHSQFAESFRRLRVQLNAVAAYPQDGRCAVVMVTSGVPQEGKTLCSIGLALAAAQAGLKTLLVDGDLRNSRVHKTFGYGESEPGLAEVLGGDVLWGTVVHGTDASNLSIMCAGRGFENSAQALAARSQELRELLIRLRGHFDLVVIDTPPVAATADAPLVAPLADATLLIVSSQQSRRTASVLARTELSRVGAEPSGLILNHMSHRDLSYHYSYYGRYGYGYGSDRSRSGDRLRTDSASPDQAA
jgi:capsular exopolysaccharide synthesis family protein